VALLSETHLKLQERFCIRNYHIYLTDRHPGLKGGTAIAVRKGIPHAHVVYPPPPVVMEATGICISTGNKEILLAAVYKPLGRSWSDADVIGLLNFRNNSILVGDLNAKNPVWNSRVSNLSRMRLLDHDFQIAAPQSLTHYTPKGNGDVFDIVVHRNVLLSDVTVSDVLDSNHLPIMLHILDHISARDFLAPVEFHTEWERFRSLSSDLVSLRIQIDAAERAACNFASSIASAYRLSTRKITLSKLNNELPELDLLLQLKRKLRKLCHKNVDPACKTAINWVTKTIRRMTWRKALTSTMGNSNK
jgi:hypothetical protein